MSQTILNDQQLDKLMEEINIEGLDYTRYNFGHFTRPHRAYHYSPEYRDEIKHLEGLNSISVGTDIYKVIKGHGAFITDEQNVRFKKFVDEQINSDRYQKGLKEKYNSYTYSYTIYTNAYLSLSSAQWYSFNDMNEKLPLDASNERDEKLKNEAINKVKTIVETLESKGFIVEGYEVEKKYFDTHYTSEEWKELVKLCRKNNEGHPTHQSRRVTKSDVAHRIEDFKELVLESTGRKMLFNWHAYGFDFIEIEPVVK